MMMKKVLVFILSILMLSACTTSQNTGTETELNSLEAVKQRGKLIVAMEGTWQPFTYHDENNNLVGFDVEVAKYIADYLGVEVEYVEGEWDGLLMGVESGRYDMLVNGCDVTEQRKQTYDFSDAYAYDKVVVMVKEDNTDITKMEDLEGKTTANTISSTYAEIAERYGATVNGVDDLTQTIELLKNGRVDATLNAEVVFLDYTKTVENAGVKIACYAEDVWDIAIPMKKNSPELVAAVNEAIAQAHADGTLSKLSEKYFGIDITKK